MRKRLAALDDVAESVLLSNIVLVEALWTLRRLYGFERAQLQDLLGQLWSARTFVLKTGQSSAALLNCSPADLRIFPTA